MMKAAIFCLIALVAVTSAHTFTGDYCGSYAGLVKGKLEVTSSTALSADLTIFGQQTKCDNEAYTLDSATGVVTIPDATSPTGCMGKLLKSYGMTAKIEYHSGSNTVDLITSAATIKMSTC